jgi:hypothetical protein
VTAWRCPKHGVVHLDPCSDGSMHVIVDRPERVCLMKCERLPEMRPGDERHRELERAGTGLTLEERQAGWHFCHEYDGGLTPGEQLDDEGRCAWCGFDGRKVVP